jgi:transposase-like protein
MMKQKLESRGKSSEKMVKDIRRATGKRRSPEEKIRIVLDGLRGEESIAELCRREGIVESLYYSWSKEFLKAGKKRLAGDTSRAGTQTPGHDKPGVVIQNSRQVIPAPTDDLEISEIRLSHLIDAHPRATIIKFQRYQ